PVVAPAELLVTAAGLADAPAELAVQIDLPDLLARLLLDAQEQAHAAQGIDVVAIDGWRGIGAVHKGVDWEIMRWAELGLPQLLALGVERQHVLVLVEGAHRVDDSPDDSHAGVALAGLVGLPHRLEALLGPLLHQALLGGVAVVVRPAEVRPVGGEEG